MVVPALFAVSALSQALSFAAGVKEAKNQNEYLLALQESQTAAAASRASAEVEGVTARAMQVRKAAAARADEVRRMAYKGIAAERVASSTAGVAGSTGSDVELDFRTRLSEQIAYDRMNLSAEEDQIQRILDTVPINQANAIEARSGVPGPSLGELGFNLMSSYISIKAKFK